MTQASPPPPGTSCAQLDFSAAMSHGDYLHLDPVLAAQHPLSPSHNEMLFRALRRRDQFDIGLQGRGLPASAFEVAALDGVLRLVVLHDGGLLRG